MEPVHNICKNILFVEDNSFANSNQDKKENLEAREFLRTFIKVMLSAFKSRQWPRAMESMFIVWKFYLHWNII